VEEEVITTFSFAPIHDETGGVGGLFITLTDPAATVLRAELARANAHLEQYNYAISHDFRSPLRTLEQMARIVVADHGPQLPTDAANLLNHVARGAAMLADRADAVSRVALLSEQTLTRRRIDVRALVNEVIVELRSAAADRHVEVVVGELPSVNADPELLRLVISSLLSNAFKFTRKVEHARIEVRGRQQARQNEYSVNDNGVGFDMKYAGRLFGFFQRLHTEVEFDGIGVGLVLARRLIERHGGSIWAEAHKDRGAAFHFTLPA
jgi:light-regulated signal transduction histidine kinase (bacteriophytochrome)